MDISLGLIISVALGIVIGALVLMYLPLVLWVVAAVVVLLLCAGIVFFLWHLTETHDTDPNAYWILVSILVIAVGFVVVDVIRMRE
jgi:hypothetical protein